MMEDEPGLNLNVDGIEIKEFSCNGEEDGHVGLPRTELTAEEKAAEQLTPPAPFVPEDEIRGELLFETDLVAFRNMVVQKSMCRDLAFTAGLQEAGDMRCEFKEMSEEELCEHP